MKSKATIIKIAKTPTPKLRVINDNLTEMLRKARLAERVIFKETLAALDRIQTLLSFTNKTTEVAQLAYM